MHLDRVEQRQFVHVLLGGVVVAEGPGRAGRRGELDACVATALRLEPDSQFAWSIAGLAYMFLEDNEPVVLTRNRIPAGLLKDDDRSHDDLPIYDFLEEYCDRRLAYYVS